MPKSRNRKEHKKKVQQYRQQMTHARRNWERMLTAGPEPVSIVPNHQTISLTDHQNNLQS